MKKLTFSTLTVMLIFVFGIANLPAQTRKSEQSKVWKRFQTAVVKGDRAAVAAFIKFPFEASISGEKFDYKIASRAEFFKDYALIFTRERRAKIARAKHTPIDGEDEFNFEMMEDGAYRVFRFRKIGGAYFLVGTIAAG